MKSYLHSYICDKDNNWKNVIDDLSTDEHFSDDQYRALLKEFINIVEDDDIPSFERRANQYPIIDQVLLKMMQAICPPNLLKKLKKTPDASVVRQVVEYLCKVFEITLVEVGKCYKFEESDCFLYF